jgi:hypothetical protein
MGRACGRAKAGQAAAATSTAAALTKDPATPGPLLYDGACVHSLAAAAKGASRREEWAREALALLRRAQAAGFFKDRRRVEHLKKDADLEALRPREEFKKFVAELEAAAKKR